MCGICGIVNRDPREHVPAGDLTRMASSLAHRGPDGQSVAELGSVGLGFRRLAIVDRSPAGAQPMCNPEQTVWVVYNGEMYNYLEERRALAAKGCTFRSKSDTEVLIRLYEEYGEACLDRMHGMFAFALWDVRSGKLFLARDRFGKKPLYYQFTDRRLLFASEIKAILAEEAAPAVDAESIHHFLSFDYVPAPRTAFRGIRKLPAGHKLVFQHDALRLSRYFQLDYTPRPPVPAPDVAASELRTKLRAAVRQRLMGEVPVGAFLSGGIDSSTIVALLAEAGEARVPTFSIGFGEATHDESRWARLVAERFGTTHREFRVTPDLASELPRIARHYDEPFGDASALPTWFLARLARADITVALTGDGGDEAFAGYPRYGKNAVAARYLSLPRPLRRTLSRLTHWLATGQRRFEHPLRQIARLASLDEVSLETLYCRWMLHFDADQKRDLYTDDFRALVTEPSCALLQAMFARCAAPDRTARELAVDVESYLPDDLMVKTDMATMAHGMEARCPFLDQDVTAFAAGLPSHFKLRGTRTKWILRRAVRDLIPAPILNRPKQGFAAPVDQWLRGELREMAHDTLLSPRAAARGWFRSNAVRRMLDEHDRRVRDWQFHLWNLLMLELWLTEVVDAERVR